LQAVPEDGEAVVKVRKPTAGELQRLREGQLLIGFLEPLTDPAGIEMLTQRSEPRLSEHDGSED